MIISIWDVFRFLYKWKWIIAAFVALCLVGTYGYIQTKQSYSSSVIIHYEDASMQEGKTPDGNAFDISEIISPNIITQALSDLSMHSNVDRVRSSMSVSPIVPNYVDELNAAKLKDGEEYTYNPTYFSVTYKDSLGLSIGSTRDILDAVMTNYINSYCNKYINKAWINEIDYDIQTDAHDYLEIAETIENNLDTINSKLSSLQSAGGGYRSPATGMTFSDLMKEYRKISDCDVPELFADIYSGQVTHNKEVLIKKYTSRRNNLQLAAKSNREQADMTKSIMDSFVAGNMDIPNSYNFADNTKNDDNIDHTQDIWYNDRDQAASGRRATYDDLIQSYVDYLVTANSNDIDANHCDEVIGKFTQPLAAGVDANALCAKVEENISAIRENLSTLYTLTNSTVEDYNSYISSQHITFLSGVKVYKNMGLRLYIIIAFVLSLVIGCIGAVVFEILQRQKALKAKD